MASSCSRKSLDVVTINTAAVSEECGPERVGHLEDAQLWSILHALTLLRSRGRIFSSIPVWLPRSACHVEQSRREVFLQALLYQTRCCVYNHSPYLLSRRKQAFVRKLQLRSLISFAVSYTTKFLAIQQWKNKMFSSCVHLVSWHWFHLKEEKAEVSFKEMEDGGKH